MGRSQELFRRAGKVIPGGVNSPVRGFGAVGGTPVFIASGSGAEITDADGRTYVDYVQSWGALLFGHAREEIVRAAREAASQGTSFGAPTEGEVRLAERIVTALPSVDVVRLTSSGTEAAMSALRLARGVTGRSKIVKFAGCYHGHADPLLVTAGSGVATLGLPDSPGVTEGAVADTIILPYNDTAAVEEVFDRSGDEIAAVIVEPVAANMGVVPPEPGFLETLANVARRSGALLVFDEVITGFRLGVGGAQEGFGIAPDLTVLGKVIGGGLPLAAFGGRRDVMERLAPAGSVYQAGTLSGNPVAVAAGLAALDLALREDPYPGLEKTGEALATGVSEALAAAGIAHTLNRAGTILSVFFGGDRVRDYEDARRANHDAYARFFHAMLDRGIYLPPSGYETWFPSAAHEDDAIDQTIEAAREAAAAV